MRCLLLRAEGYSYEQICEITGWTYTKVNRCLSEGRRAFFERVAGIEAGAECERLAPLLSALADGEAGAEELAALRPHLQDLPDLPRTPARVPRRPRPGWRRSCRRRSWPPARAGDGPGALRSLVESVVGATHDKAAALGERAHAAAELATGQKLAAVAASAAAIAGGGAGVERLAERARRARPAAGRPGRAGQRGSARRHPCPSRRRPRAAPVPGPRRAGATARARAAAARPRERVRARPGRRRHRQPRPDRAPPSLPAEWARPAAAARVAANSAPNRSLVTEGCQGNLE